MIPSTINSEQDYDSILFQSEEKNASPTPKNKKSRGEEVKKTRSKESKNPRTQENKNSRSKQVKNSGSVEKKTAKKESPMLSTPEIDHNNQEVKTPITRQIKKSISKEVKTSRTKEPKKSRNKELKKSKVIIDEEGKIRRPANIMMKDDIKIALDVLAARRRVWSWQLIDQALREFLEREDAL